MDPVPLNKGKRKAKQLMILVTGDVVLDHNVYAGTRLTPVSDAPRGTRYSKRPGGAMWVYSLLDALFQVGMPSQEIQNSSTSSQLAFGLSDATADGLESWPTAFHAGAIWEPFDCPRDGKLHWRLSKNLGYGPRESSKYPASPAVGLERLKPGILVIDDGGLGFRWKTASQCWPPFLRTEKNSKDLQWIILKMSRPLGRGDLWRELKDQYRERLIVIVSADNLRSEDAQVSLGLSWESAVDDLIREIHFNPGVRGLQECRHLIIALRSDAALWLDQPSHANPVCCHLVFDREHGEGERVDSTSGSSFGYLSAITASLVAHVSNAPPKDSTNLVPALKAGLSTARFLIEYGHGPIDTPDPAFPFKAAALHMKSPTKEYAAVEIRRGGTAGYESRKNPAPDRKWTILGQSCHSEVFPGALYGPARRVALLGPGALENIPFARFGKLLTMDRREIEGLRSLRQLMLSYHNSGAQKQPLSLAVFGAPGSGKSFGLKQIAEAVFADKNQVLEFNLSQFKGPDDLIGAYHQVRDHVLAGKTPVVFWDEFDSRNNFWLQYLLAPMQDGVFQEGQHSHAIGKCIFVFAGGTSRDFAHFGPSDDPELGEAAAEVEARHDFIAAKGPDFKSRLAGFLDVLGPNPRQIYDEAAARKGLAPWKDDPSDVDFPVRRALLLRSLLGLTKNQEDAPLVIDHGLLTALLEASHYRNGARSMEKLIGQLRDRGGVPLGRAHLPANAFLALYVDDVPGFHSMIRGSDRFLDQAERLAPILHQDWRDGLPKREKGGALDVPFEELDQEGRAANVAAAARIPEILALAGFHLEEGTATVKQEAEVRSFLQNHVEFLAEAEHKGWEAQKRMEGWTYAPERDNVTRKHPLLVPYADLSEEQMGKDRRTILNYPKYARKARFKIVSRRLG